MDCNKATGADNIPALFIKKLSCFFVEPITRLINMSFIQCSVPTLWKRAQVTPIQKKKGDLSLNNFRPISVLPVISKIAEKVIHQQLLHFLESSGLLCNAQSGFRPGHSTQDLLLHLVDSWRRSIDKKEAVGQFSLIYQRLSIVSITPYY